MRVRDRLGLAPRRQRQLSWLMEVGLVAILGVGILDGESGVIVNAGVALLVAQLPPILQRDHGIPMDPALTLWITAAVFLHALGTVTLPFAESTFYASVPWWDHLTHALSSSVVAAVGYAAARAVDVHSDRVRLPPEFMFAFLLLVVLAFGVFCEVVEFTISEVAAVIGSETVLTQYGLSDTMLDLLFNTLGAVVAATWGTAYLGDVVGALAARLDARVG